MKKTLMVAATLVALMGCASLAQAQAQIYSFEGGLEGMAPNGGGVSVTSDTIGATSGSNSMKVAVVTGATFVGALDQTPPALVNNPPGAEYLTFDMTLQEPFTGGFAVIGVTMFGASQPDFPGGQLFGLQAQFADFEHIGGKAPGTYNVRIDLSSATNQVDFSSGQTFNQIFGSGPNQQIPTGFQLFVNKSNDQPVSIFIDNVRIAVPEPATGMLLGLGASAIGLVAGRRRGR